MATFSPPEDLDTVGLAVDFESSLQGLGEERGTAAYNMTQVLALPIFNLDSTSNQAAAGQHGPHTSNETMFQMSHLFNNDKEQSPTQQQQHQTHQQAHQHQLLFQHPESSDSFQYILCAATSPAIKINEESLTYLNQGQSYELKLKKIGEPSDNGQLYKSLVSVTFHDKRLQFSEQEQLQEWKLHRPGDRILDLDIPLSYGVTQYYRNPTKLNVLEFLWEAKKDIGVFLQVHCISTEFTEKKRGGEKGVPFRIQVSTYQKATLNSDDYVLVDSASCRIKVFKPKGADRKHKTDREKMEKRTDRDNYQPSYLHTVLSTCSFENAVSSSEISFNTSGDSALNRSSNSTAPVVVESSHHSPLISLTSPLLPSATIQETQQWLKENRFGAFCKLFQHFTGADLLRLSREDFIQILGTADGIRLNNDLQERQVRPRLQIYVCQEPDQVYHALYLELPTAEELKVKIAQLYNVLSDKLSQVLFKGPSGIRVLVSDEMVQNFQEESAFIIEALKDDNSDTYTVILKG